MYRFEWTCLKRCFFNSHEFHTKTSIYSYPNYSKLNRIPFTTIFCHIYQSQIDFIYILLIFNCASMLFVAMGFCGWFVNLCNLLWSLESFNFTKNVVFFGLLMGVLKHLDKIHQLVSLINNLIYLFRTIFD